MNKNYMFKVGDHVVGNDQARKLGYTITHKGRECVVISVEGSHGVGYMRVSAIGAGINQGTTHIVEMDAFDPLHQTIEEKRKANRI